MARRKKSHAKRHHTKRRHHRMSGIGGGLTSAVYIAGGAVLAQVIMQKLVDPMFTSSTTSATTKGLIDGATPIVLGMLTPKFIKGDIGAKLGAGMIAVGGLNLVKTTGLISGIGANYYSNKPVRNIAGYSAHGGSYIAGVRNAAIMEHC